MGSNPCRKTVIKAVSFQPELAERVLNWMAYSATDDFFLALTKVTDPAQRED